MAGASRTYSSLVNLDEASFPSTMPTNSSLVGYQQSITRDFAGSPPTGPLVSMEPSEIINEIIMALHVGEKSCVGCAYFSTADSTLYLSEDIPMAALDVIEHFISHVKPTTLLVSARTPRHLLDFIENKAEPRPDIVSAGYIFRVLVSQEFSYSSACERLAGLDLDKHTGATVSSSHDSPTINSNSEPHNIKLLRCGSFVHLDSHASVSCAGAILGDLHRRRSVGLLPDGQSAELVFHVLSLKMFAISDYMFISPETLLALQIVQSEFHPNTQTWGSEIHNMGSKESLSVYGLFQAFVCTAQGRNALRQIFFRPTLNMSIISERQRSIASLLRSDNSDLVKRAVSILRKIRNVKAATAQLRKGVDSPAFSTSFDRGVWATVRGFAAQALRLREVVGNLHDCEDVTLFNELLEAIEPSLFMRLGDMVNRTVDFEQSKARNRLSIKPGLDPQLDELKRRYDGVGSLLTKVVDDSTKHLPPKARKCIRSCIFLPQLGFLMVVAPDPQNGLEQYQGEYAGGNRWERVFTADGSVCYKTEDMRELDKLYGDMYCEIGDLEVEIMHRLARDILKYEQVLATASDLCGHFDSILALALGAEKYALVAPQMTDTNVLLIKNGRHPLQELIVPSFVPNDCHISVGVGPNSEDEQRGDDIPQAMLLTGPNHSGKSVYLKQTAIIVFLAHIGCYVPAEKALVGLTDRILTRISTKESMSRDESAFAIDLKGMAQAMRCSTPRSLLLVDEFGKGTNADDGAGLFAALLCHFLSTGYKGPRLLLATHFHELFESTQMDDLHGVQLTHMVVRSISSTGHEPDRITYLYRLAQGYSNSSFGTRCAALNSVPSEIVMRAEAITQLLCQNEDLTSACRKLSVQEKTHLQYAEEVARKFLEVSFNERDNDCWLVMRALGDVLSMPLPKESQREVMGAEYGKG